MSYRDDLAAAQARAEALERDLHEQGRKNAAAKEKPVAGAGDATAVESQLLQHLLDAIKYRPGAWHHLRVAHTTTYAWCLDNGEVADADTRRQVLAVVEHAFSTTLWVGYQPMDHGDLVVSYANAGSYHLSWWKSRKLRRALRTLGARQMYYHAEKQGALKR